MHRINARELMDDPDYVCRLTIDGYYDLLLRAGYSGDEARRATTERSWDRLTAGESI